MTTMAMTTMAMTTMAMTMMAMTTTTMMHVPLLINHAGICSMTNGYTQCSSYYLPTNTP